MLNDGFFFGVLELELGDLVFCLLLLVVVFGGIISFVGVDVLKCFKLWVCSWVLEVLLEFIVMFVLEFLGMGLFFENVCGFWDGVFCLVFMISCIRYLIIYYKMNILFFEIFLCKLFFYVLFLC